MPVDSAFRTVPQSRGNPGFNTTSDFIRPNQQSKPAQERHKASLQLRSSCLIAASRLEAAERLTDSSA